ncbi:META domain-containing protein [Microbacterium sp.]|uniref:META domain-containing protein n=1 Tax=Microbacterium sp. TaxID=51671 RepID=UPI002811F2A6|nr:META domain-containing protein [Microbacterium sp.]
MSLRSVRSVMTLASAAVFAVLITSCAAGTDPGPAPTSTGSSVGVAADVVGGWGEDAAGKPYLEFTEGGDVRGTDGCNGIVSTFKVEEDRVEVAPFASTLKSCQGVDDWLRGVRAVEIDGDRLIVMDAAGERLGELARAK